MTGRYKTYPEYKDSGVEWIRSLPVGWTETKLGRLAYMQEGPGLRTWQFTDSGVKVICVTNITDSGIDFSRLEKFISTEEYLTGYKRFTVNRGDILLSSSGNSWGKVAIYKGNEDVILNTSTIRLNELSSGILSRKYLFWLLQSTTVKEQLNLAMTGACQPNFGPSHLNEVIVPIVPVLDQQKIANFLDHETVKIDSLIAKQEKLIELLKEKRQAVISHAVTKGLNPDAPMKNSGVEWLGEVPEHWDLKRFKHLFKVRKRIAGKTGYDILSITQKGIKIKDITSGEGQLSMDYSKYQLVYKSDFAMNHMDLLTGFVDISSHDGVTSPDYRVFTLEHKSSVAEYYLRLLQMGYLDKLFYPLGQGAAHIGRWRLPTEAFNEFIAPCPPYEEQKEISHFVNKTHSKIDALLEKAEEAITLMKERKTALISAAVTGKIDVRDWESSR